MLRRKYREASEKISTNPERNLELLATVYNDFVDFAASENNVTSEKLRRIFGETPEDFRRKFGDKKALLIFLIVLEPQISAVAASEKTGVSDRTIETYLADLKGRIIERIGPDKGGHWKIVVQ